MNRFLLLLIILLFVFQFSDVRAQSSLSFESAGIISSTGSTPFWLQSNRHGMIARNGTQLLTRLQYHNVQEDFGPFSIYYGVDVIARPGSQATLSFNQGYLRVEAYGLKLAAGRFHNTSPIHADDLSMGSLGISRNATPIPQIRAGFADWFSIPFTRDFIQINAYLAHGWLGSRRYTDDLLLHEKVGHVKLGGNLPVNIYAGIAHYVKWGGNNHPEFGNIPTRWSDYFNVFFAMPGDEQTPGPMQNYVLGDHLGAIDFGMTLNFRDTDILIYRQLPLESRDNLKLKSLQDALNGISITLPDDFRLPVNRFVYEFLYTKYQDGPRRSNIGGDLVRDLYRGNENYYNHGVYRSGWVYNLQTIGNPLFIPSDSNLGVLNNRIVAHHVGMSGSYSSVTYSAKATYSRNYGKYCDNRVPNLGDEEIFGYQCINTDNGMEFLDDIVTVGGHAVNQWSFLAGIETPVIRDENRVITLILQIALDSGGLVGNQVGGLAGIRWQPSGRR